MFHVTKNLYYPMYSLYDQTHLLKFVDNEIDIIKEPFISDILL